MTMNQNDHDQIIDQIISLENDFSDASSAMLANVIVSSSADNNNVAVINSDPIVTTAISSTTSPQIQHHINMSDMNQSMMGMQLQQHQHHDQQQQQHQQQNIHLQQPCVMSTGSDDNDRQRNQLSTSSEDLLNLLLEFDRDSSNLVSGIHPFDQDEKIGIETIRKQLMSCEVQSEQLLHHQHQQHHQQQHNNIGLNHMACHSPQPQQHSRLPISHQQSLNHQQHSPIPELQNQNLNQQHSPIPPLHHQNLHQQQQHHQHSRLPSLTHQNLHHHSQQHHHSLPQQRSPTLSVIQPATTTTTAINVASTEPSSVVKKNPLLNAQLVNSRAPSNTSSRFTTTSNQNDGILNQNPTSNNQTTSLLKQLLSDDNK